MALSRKRLFLCPPPKGITDLNQPSYKFDDGFAQKPYDYRQQKPEAAQARLLPPRQIALDFDTLRLDTVAVYDAVTVDDLRLHLGGVSLRLVAERMVQSPVGRDRGVRLGERRL